MPVGCTRRLPTPGDRVVGEVHRQNATHLQEFQSRPYVRLGGDRVAVSDYPLSQRLELYVVPTRPCIELIWLRLAFVLRFRCDCRQTLGELSIRARRL